MLGRIVSSAIILTLLALFSWVVYRAVTSPDEYRYEGVITLSGIDAIFFSNQEGVYISSVDSLTNSATFNYDFCAAQEYGGRFGIEPDGRSQSQTTGRIMACVFAPVLFLLDVWVLTTVWKRKQEFREEEQ